MNLEPGQSIHDPCQRCGHFRLSHMDPLTGKPSHCRRCQLKIDSTPEPGERYTERFKRVEDRGIACTAFLEIQLEERH